MTPARASPGSCAAFVRLIKDVLKNPGRPVRYKKRQGAVNKYCHPNPAGFDYRNPASYATLRISTGCEKLAAVSPLKIGPTATAGTPIVSASNSSLPTPVANWQLSKPSGHLQAKTF
jgi:hypothetical protein